MLKELRAISQCVLGFGVFAVALVHAVFCMACDRGAALRRKLWNSAFDWLEDPGYTKDGQRLYTSYGGDPYARSGLPEVR